MPSSFPVVFIWFLIAIFIFRHHMRKNDHAQEKVSDAFWHKEESSLVVRKKALAPEDYVIIHLKAEDLKDQAYYDQLGVPELFRQDTHLRDLLDQPMVNFQHTTNTDLRLTYGTAMITTIEAYEESYIAYITTLYRMGDKLMSVKDEPFACQLLEEGIAVGTDNRKHYLLLAQFYKEKGYKKEIQLLIDKANNLESLTKNLLIKELNQLLAPLDESL